MGLAVVSPSKSCGREWGRFRRGDVLSVARGTGDDFPWRYFEPVDECVVGVLEVLWHCGYPHDAPSNALHGVPNPTPVGDNPWGARADVGLHFIHLLLQFSRVPLRPASSRH